MGVQPRGTPHGLDPCRVTLGSLGRTCRLLSRLGGVSGRTARSAWTLDGLAPTPFDLVGLALRCCGFRARQRTAEIRKLLTAEVDGMRQGRGEQAEGGRAEQGFHGAYSIACARRVIARDVRSPRRRARAVRVGVAVKPRAERREGGGRRWGRGRSAALRIVIALIPRLERPVAVHRTREAQAFTPGAPALDRGEALLAHTDSASPPSTHALLRGLARECRPLPELA